jgi:hypothetical protein
MLADDPVPEVLRQSEQWQMLTLECKPRISNRMPLRRQLPFSMNS